MWPSLSKSGLLLLAATALPFVSAKERVIRSTSLNPCMENSRLTASLFNVAFTPSNRSLNFDIVAMSTISSRVMVNVELIVYGYSALKESMNPCNSESEDLKGLCPMNTGSFSLRKSSLPISADLMSKVPGIAYTIPDLDAKVRIRISDQNTSQIYACVEAELSNGHTVHQKAVAWVTAVIAGLGLVASAITSGLGHTNTAAHVAANAMSLFGYFQAQALLGMMAVPVPPIVAAWTQNFQWSMGIIRVGFLQKLATWYQRSTGGTPTTHLSSLSDTSIQVQKRSLETTDRMARLMGRSNAGAADLVNKHQTILRGIERVGFYAKMETTNIFMTGYTFFIVFILLTTLSVIAFKFICEGLVKAGKMKSDKFLDFRNGWQTVLKGIMYRVVLIGFPQMMVLCFWEYTQLDSPAEVVLAVFTMITMIGILAWASSKVVRIAQRSIAMHKNPAYILYSDPVALNKWGFLYVQFKAAAYWFIIPLLIHVLIKALFIGVAQKNGVAQAIALLLIEAALLVGVCVMRPYMDKKTNGFNIAIAAINFVGSIFFLFFSDVFGAPDVVAGAMGVVFFVYNCVFALVLLLMVLVSSGFALFTKNPDNRYQPMRDDRGSFIKSQTQLTTELDALGATARGEGKGTHPQSRIDDDDDSFSSSEHQRQMASKEGHFSEHYQPAPPRSPIERSASPYGAQPQHQNPNSVPPSYYGRNSPAPSNGYGRTGSLRNEPTNRSNNNSSPWQRGAGYDGH